MTTDEFALDLRACLTPPHHLAVHSGRCVVQPMMPTVCGVGSCFAPPLAARGMQFTVSLSADDRRIPDNGSTGKGDCGLLYAGGRWLPDRIERHGTYHYRTDGALVSLRAESTLVPLRDRAGFVLHLAVTNRSERHLLIDAAADVNPGRPSQWPL